MIPPTAAEVQGWTTLDALKNADALTADRVVARANASFVRMTGQTWPGLPVALEPLAQQAAQGLAELTILQSSAENLETLADFDLIQSFSAGPYSETRRSPADAMKARMLVAWPWLNELLWGLLTDDKYDYWIAFFSGLNAPATAVTEMDWGAYRELPSPPSYYDKPPIWGG